MQKNEIKSNRNAKNSEFCRPSKYTIKEETVCYMSGKEILNQHTEKYSGIKLKIESLK